MWQIRKHDSSLQESLFWAGFFLSTRRSPYSNPTVQGPPPPHPGCQLFLFPSTLVSASFPSKSYLLELRLKNKAHAQGSWWGGGIQKFRTTVQFLRERGREELPRPVTSSPHKGQGPLMCWQVQGPDAEIISHHYFLHFPRRQWKMNTIYLPHGKIKMTLEQVVC